MQRHNNIRYDALSDDWNRQRDTIIGYRKAVRWTLWGAVTWVVILLLVVVLSGCAAPLLPKEPRIGARGAPDLYLEDGTPCWYIAAARHPLVCNRR